MQTDKALLPFGQSKTLAQYQLNRVENWFESVHISCKNSKKFDFKASFIEDLTEFDEFSPLIALYSILKRVQSSVAILSVDTPFVTEEIYKKLYKNMNGSEALIAKSPFGSHQMCAIYSASILPVLKNQILDDNHKIRNLLEKIKTKYIEFESDEPFFNLNRPDEYKKACERISG